MLERLDWKFFLTLAITIASVAVPVWIWQLDLSSKALTLTVSSITEIQPLGVSEFEGVQLLADGKPLVSPFVSVLELANSGSRPIVASDFEGPVKIVTAHPSTIRKARHASSTPTTLQPVLTNTEGALQIQPLLLNPGDVIRFALITADGRPSFAAQARIAGVADVAITNRTTSTETKRLWTGRAIAILLMAVYMANMFEFALAGVRKKVFLPWSLVKGLISAFGGTWILVIQTPNGPPSTTSILPLLLISTLLAGPSIYRHLRRTSAAS